MDPWHQVFQLQIIKVVPVMSSAPQCCCGNKVVTQKSVSGHSCT